MKLHNALLVAAMSFAAFAAVSLPGVASAETVVYFNVAPPPPRTEPAQKPRKGFVWAPGYWDAQGNRHVWIAGHWERERKGYRYAPPTWTQDGDRWRLEHGHWVKVDPGADGAASKHDRAPKNPARQ
jgi:hypothetical protein